MSLFRKKRERKERLKRRVEEKREVFLIRKREGCLPAGHVGKKRVSVEGRHILGKKEGRGHVNR